MKTIAVRITIDITHQIMLIKSVKKDITDFFQMLKLKTKAINIVIISANTYHTACCLKKAQIFAVSMNDIKYQVAEKVKAKTNPKSFISQEY